jgi:hypothetical protein
MVKGIVFWKISKESPNFEEKQFEITNLFLEDLGQSFSFLLLRIAIFR